MFTSFFNKSKPINFLVVGVFMSLYYVLENYVLTSVPVSLSYGLKKFGFLLIYLFLMVLINFIVKRNQVTEKNSFTIVLFALFTVSFSAILENGKVLVSALFILLALRRIISLKSEIAVKNKIFDASFWIALSALFFEWSLLFFVIVYLAILLHAASDYRNWIIPIMAILCVFILYTCFHLLVYDSFFKVLTFFRAPDFNFFNYGEPYILLPLSFMLAFALWIIVDFLLVIKNAARNLKPSLVLVLAIWVISIFVVIFSHTKDGSELLFFIIPTSIIGANYFQRKKEKTFKEVLLIVLAITTLLWPFLV